MKRYGWDEAWEQRYQSTGVDMPAARVTGQYGRFLKCMTPRGEVLAEVSGRLSYMSVDASDLPVAGDWVLLLKQEQGDAGLIYDILPRRSWITRRKTESRHREQIIAANVDVLCIVTALDESLNLNTVERYMLLAAEGRTESLLIFNKQDLCESLAETRHRIEERFQGAPTCYLSCKTGTGLQELHKMLKPHHTHAFVGPSGVGKSTIINTFLNEERQKTGQVRSTDSKGRHITSSRELFLSSDEIILLDTPGLRELGLTGEEYVLNEVHGAIADASQHCRFNDCTHTVENNCAVKQGVEQGTILREQYENYLKMRRELQHLERKEEQGGSYNAKKRWKDISKEIRRMKKHTKKPLQ
jgi:ribosome biogenesis GTPase